MRCPTMPDALFELADADATRWFSWGPYEPSTSRAPTSSGLEAKREAGTLLDFLAVHAEHGPVGVTGLSEYNAPRPPRHGRHVVRPRALGDGGQRRVQGADRAPGVRAPRAQPADRVGQHPQRPLADRARAARLPPRGRPARRTTCTPAAPTTSSPSGCCGRDWEAAAARRSPSRVGRRGAGRAGRGRRRCSISSVAVEAGARVDARGGLVAGREERGLGAGREREPRRARR